MSELVQDTWLRIYDSDGAVSVDAGEEPRVSAAVSAFVDSGCTKDTLLDLSLLSGSVYYTKASLVTSWFISTPEHRRMEIQHQGAYDEEAKGIKADLGIWEPDA